jgi:hypothetical protein
MAVIEAIATTYLEADAATVTFGSIPATYEHLQLRISSRGDTTAAHSPDALIRFNSDTGTNYSNHSMYGDASTVTAVAETGASSIKCGATSGSYGTSKSTEFAGSTIDILDYRNASKNTTVQFTTGLVNNEKTIIRQGSGLWDDTSAVTQIDLLVGSGGWSRGSEFTLYGLNSA